MVGSDAVSGAKGPLRPRNVEVCKGRHVCPSCHARRLAEWSLWLDERLLAPVAHRQIVLTVPKRLRLYFLS